jgi:hypothetical protein
MKKYKRSTKYRNLVRVRGTMQWNWIVLLKIKT